MFRISFHSFAHRDGLELAGPQAAPIAKPDLRIDLRHRARPAREARGVVVISPSPPTCYQLAVQRARLVDLA